MIYMADVLKKLSENRSLMLILVIHAGHNKSKSAWITTGAFDFTIGLCDALFFYNFKAAYVAAFLCDIQHVKACR